MHTLDHFFIQVEYFLHQIVCCNANPVSCEHSPYGTTLINTITIIPHPSRLVTLYSVSVFVGGLTHQYFETFPGGIKSIYFRLVWSACVGAVGLASGVIGRLGTLFHRSHFETCYTEGKRKVHEREGERDR
jgi:hypothetical protein